MDVLTTLVAIIAVTLAGWLTPGPNMIAVMSASLYHGRANGIAVGIGITIGNLLWLVLALSGATLLFELFPTAIFILKLIGAGYLIFLGVKSIKAARSSQVSMELIATERKRLISFVRVGAIVALTNPKSALFFGSIFAAFVPSDTPLIFLYIIAVICSIQSAVQHAITATIFSTQPTITFFSAFRKWITGLFGFLFLGLGGAVIVSTLKNQ